jgi:ZIP family zinc transporter
VLFPTSLVVGVLASSALVIGSSLGTFWTPPEDVVAAALAFSSGALITALAFDLFQQAFDMGGPWYAGGGLMAGAAVFVGADILIDRYAASQSGFALLAGVTLDGVPENTALGVTIAGGGHVHYLTLLVAIFASNLPESLNGAADMRGQNYSKVETVALWVFVAGLLTAAVMVGDVVSGGFHAELLAAVRAFAGGAVLASLAATVMPEAFDEGGPLVALATAAGFLLTFVLTS